MELLMIAVALTLGAAVPATGNVPSRLPAQRHFTDQLSCEQAASIATPPPGTKLVCAPAGGSGPIHNAH